MNEQKNIDRIVKTLCANASFSDGTVSEGEIDEFLENHSTFYFCCGRGFHIEFEKITNKTYRVKRRWA